MDPEETTQREQELEFKKNRNLDITLFRSLVDQDEAHVREINRVKTECQKIHAHTEKLNKINIVVVFFIICPLIIVSIIWPPIVALMTILILYSLYNSYRTHLNSNKIITMVHDITEVTKVHSLNTWGCNNIKIFYEYLDYEDKYELYILREENLSLVGYIDKNDSLVKTLNILNDDENND